MKKAVFTTAALAIGASLVGGAAAAASAAPAPAPAPASGLLGVMSPTKVTPAVVPAADVVTHLARDGKIANGSAFDQKRPDGGSGVYLDGMDPNSAKKPTIPVKNPAGRGDVQVHPLQAPTAVGLGSLLGK
ncbi:MULTISPECIES: hypothetical protein [unclassified Streptomyces]|uniref:hypothetical protein n=1 Tax=unclassified Streptomyces TaxID=2593676 RepID=UPI00224DF027|nr:MULTISPECIES: hypothetical protein [unclassified Streptomyces]MCX5048304.1 hypothetical protein [Streptomyces sp. NBC_00474]MCX5056962.1 hypothetical protein [Streptomyces sp. NBC_00452]MCX5246117.1 hypothetical protein [Streptomyces sp. NBC_00201]MCX5288054.1 hypothetical protein [Streptomyces sp. NBC_00183]